MGARLDMTALTVLATFGILGFGYYRSRPFGQLGLFSWLQSAILLIPWLLFFGLLSAGIYLSFATVLLLLVGSTAIYIALGRQVRALTPLEPEKIVEVEEIIQPEQLIAVEKSSKTPENIPDDDLDAIKSIFGFDTFFITETLPYQSGAIFNGNLRGDPAIALASLTASLEARMGDRYRLFLIANPEGKPTIVTLPKSRDPQVSTPWQKFVAVGLFFATIVTCMETASFLLGFDLYEAPNRYREVLPIGLGLITVLVTHELGHWFIAQKYNVKLSWPFFLPTWQIGAFGAITRFESLLADRRVLFDIALAGPAAGGILSLVFLVTGLLLSHPGSLFHFPTAFFEGSILVGTLAKITLQSALEQSMVDVHPLVIIGWVGLLMTAINLMPAGRLDGGRMIQAIYGRPTANRTTVATLIVLTLVAVVNPLALYWAILILFLQRNLERPALNEISELDDGRAALGLLALLMMILILLPLTPSLAGSLGIGG
jgi:membrane-associated protease RseP (regulator of RpoE activity)